MDIENEGSRRHGRLIAAVVIAAAAVAGCAMMATAMFATRDIPFTARAYADWTSNSGLILIRISAYDARNRTPLPVRSAAIKASGAAPRFVNGEPDGTALLSAQAESIHDSGRLIAVIRTDKGSRELEMEPAHPVFRLPELSFTPVSFEFRTGPALQIGLGTQGLRDERENAGALDGLPAVPYPEQGRLASNMPNRIFLWGRACTDGVEVETAAGKWRAAQDQAGMAVFSLVPTFGATWIKAACGGREGRVDLRDRPRGITVSPAFILSAPGREVSFDASTMFAAKPFTMDVFHECRWLAGRTVTPENKEARIRFTLPAKQGLYSFELYGNTHKPGDERARALVLAVDDHAGALKKLVKRVKGADGDPLVGHLPGLVSNPGADPPAVQNAAAALASRINLECGPPPMVVDSLSTDERDLMRGKEKVRHWTLSSLMILWLASAAGTGIVMLARLRGAARGEERIEGHGRQIIIQHAAAAGILTIAFAMLYFALSMWWG
jgi:hypothetical protein